MMMKRVWVVATNPVEGREEEYNEWYDNVHVPEVCSLDGVLNATRYEIENPDSTTPHRYIAIYELDRDDESILAALLEARASGAFLTSDSVDMATASSTFWHSR